MRTKQLFLILALLCAMVQGARAQASWDEVYAMTNTTSANWTALPEGTTAGATISPSPAAAAPAAAASATGTTSGKKNQVRKNNNNETINEPNA